MERVFNKVRNLDAYPKINEDFYSRTLSGGVITLVSSIVMFLLFFSELGKLSLFLFNLKTLIYCLFLLLFDLDRCITNLNLSVNQFNFSFFEISTSFYLPVEFDWDASAFLKTSFLILDNKIATG